MIFGWSGFGISFIAGAGSYSSAIAGAIAAPIGAGLAVAAVLFTQWALRIEGP